MTRQPVFPRVNDPECLKVFYELALYSLISVMPYWIYRSALIRVGGEHAGHEYNARR